MAKIDIRNFCLGLRHNKTQPTDAQETNRRYKFSTHRIPYLSRKNTEIWILTKFEYLHEISRNLLIMKSFCIQNCVNLRIWNKNASYRAKFTANVTQFWRSLIFYSGSYGKVKKFGNLLAKFHEISRNFTAAKNCAIPAFPSHHFTEFTNHDRGKSLTFYHEFWFNPLQGENRQRTRNLPFVRSGGKSFRVAMWVNRGSPRTAPQHQLESNPLFT